MDSVYYTVRQIEVALKPVLGGGGGSIPIPPLIELIAQYAVPRVGLVSVRGEGRAFAGPIGLVRVPPPPPPLKSETKDPASSDDVNSSESVLFISYDDSKISKLRLSDSTHGMTRDPTSSGDRSIAH